MRIVIRYRRRVQTDLAKRKTKRPRVGIKRRQRLIRSWSKPGRRIMNQTDFSVEIQDASHHRSRMIRFTDYEKRTFCRPGKRTRWGDASKHSFVNGRFSYYSGKIGARR